MKPFFNSTLLRSEHITTDFFNITYSGYSFPKHFHDTLLIQVVERGINKFFCNGSYYTAGENCVVVINPGDIHTGNTLDNQQLTYKVFYPSEIYNPVDDPCRNSRGTIYFKENVICDKELANKILSLYYKLENNICTLSLQETYCEILLMLAKRTAPLNYPLIDKNRYRQSMQRVVEYMNDNLDNKFSLTQLARIALLSPFHFLRVFKNIAGLTPNEYLINLRIEKCKQLLKRGTAIPDIVYATGFSDQSHLTRVFKKMTGTTPKKFIACS